MKNLKIYTSFVSPITFKSICDSNILPIFIIKSIKNSSLIGGFEGTAIHFKQLAPSTDLFRQKRDGSIDFSEFSKRYIIEMSQVNLPEVLETISYLTDLCNTDKVVLLSYGSDPTKCHRSLLGEILNQSGLLQNKITELIL